MTVTLKDGIKVEGSVEDVYALLKKIGVSTIKGDAVSEDSDTPDLSKFTYDYSRGYIDGYQEGMKDRNPQVNKTTDNPDESSKNVKWTPIEDFMKNLKTKGTYDGPCYVPDYARPDESCQKQSKITRLNNPDVPYDHRLNNPDSPDMTRTEAPYNPLEHDLDPTLTKTKPYNPFEHDTGIEYWYNQPTCTGDYTPPTSTTTSDSTSGTSRCVLWSGASSDSNNWKKSLQTVDQVKEPEVITKASKTTVMTGKGVVFDDKAYDQEKEDEWFNSIARNNYKLCIGED